MLILLPHYEILQHDHIITQLLHVWYQLYCLTFQVATPSVQNDFRTFLSTSEEVFPVVQLVSRWKIQFVDTINIPRIIEFHTEHKYITVHSTLRVNLIKLFQKRKQLLQHESITPIESGITSSQILQIQN